MKYLLVVLFFTAEGEPPKYVNGFLPTLQPSAKVCEIRGELLHQQLLITGAPPHTIKCYIELGDKL